MTVDRAHFGQATIKSKLIGNCDLDEWDLVPKPNGSTVGIPPPSQRDVGIPEQRRCLCEQVDLLAEVSDLDSEPAPEPTFHLAVMSPLAISSPVYV